jgi:hypothetical protein
MLRGGSKEMHIHGHSDLDLTVGTIRPICNPFVHLTIGRRGGLMTLVLDGL